MRTGSLWLNNNNNNHMWFTFVVKQRHIFLCLLRLQSKVITAWWRKVQFSETRRKRGSRHNSMDEYVVKIYKHTCVPPQSSFEHQYCFWSHTHLPLICPDNHILQFTLRVTRPTDNFADGGPQGGPVWLLVGCLVGLVGCIFGWMTVFSLQLFCLVHLG